MHAVGRVVVQVVQVDEQRLLEIPLREILVPDLRGEDRLHDRRERRVTRGQRIVVIEVGFFSSGEKWFPCRNSASTTSACLSTWNR